MTYSFAHVLAEAEAQRKAQEAHAEAVEIARREDLRRLAAEGDKQKWTHKGPKPVRVGGPIIDNASRGQQRDLCRKNRSEIAVWIASGSTFVQIAKMLTETEKIKVAAQSVRLFCRDNGIQKPEELKTAQKKLTAAIEEIKALIDSGASRAELCEKYQVSKTSMGEFFMKHGLSTRSSRKIKKSFNTLYRRFA